MWRRFRLTWRGLLPGWLITAPPCGLIGWRITRSSGIGVCCGLVYAEAVRAGLLVSSPVLDVPEGDLPVTAIITPVAGVAAGCVGAVAGSSCDRSLHSVCEGGGVVGCSGSGCCVGVVASGYHDSGIKKYAKLENKGTIEAPWGGTQDYDSNSFFCS